MLDLHHIPNVKDSKRLIKGYVLERSIAISIPSNEHKIIKYDQYVNVHTARTLLAREIRNVRRCTNVPVSSLIRIIEANKNIYPESFKK